jgi:hypothetical protein
MLQIRSRLLVSWLTLLFSGVLACSSSDSQPDAGGGGGTYAGDATLDADTGSSDPDGSMHPLCVGSRCAPGQKCDATTGEPLCVPTCENVQCDDGEHCEIDGSYGVCVERCVPACGSGQRCETGACVDNTCEDLDCDDKEVCVAAAQGSGNLCKDNTCEDDVGCPEDQSCRDGVCVGDACTPGARRCDERRLLECAPNGASELVRMTCTRAKHTESECVSAASSAYCSCRDDWDCPEFSSCTLGRCEGTGRTPHCLLPPTSFASLLPADEPGFPWGGNDADGFTMMGGVKHGANARSRDAKGHPFPMHSQGTTTPVVANLDDDNGDGLINELDIPELVFTSFCDNNYFLHGVLRALHGGGANAGKELFARCDDKLWQEGDPILDDQDQPLPAANCACNDGDIEPTGALAVGDLDGDGLPEIVVVAHTPTAATAESPNSRVLILNRRGEVISDNDVSQLAGADPAVTLANVDGQGFAEIVVGARVMFLSDDNGTLRVSRTLRGEGSQGLNNSQGAIACVADLDDDGRMEVVAGGTAYKVPAGPAGACPNDTSSASDDVKAFCENKLRIMWQAVGVDGFCAVADVLAKRDSEADPEPLAGPAAPLDGKPEVVIIGAGWLRIFDGRTGLSRVNVTLFSSGSTPVLGENGDGAGGAPNIDDFDGDGFPEIGSAGATAYVLHDLQPPTAACPAWPMKLDGRAATDPMATDNPNPARDIPAQSCDSDDDCGDTAQFVCGKQGTCVCLHNGWRSLSDDSSSNVTGSSVFDFNGDGAAEVVYNDECYFRIYDGSTGSVYQRLESQSPTRIEYPVVADVDNDGNAEIVFAASNARSEGCPASVKVNGLRVIGDPSDGWVAARRIWNQHAYHVTNVLESGALPEQETPSWLSYGNRTYNTYRSNLPPFGHVAPDLTVLAVAVTSPSDVCGEALSRDIRIVARIVNQGDLRVGQGVIVRFYDQDDKLLGESPLGVSLEPAGEVRITLDHQAKDDKSIPSEVRVVVDALEEERECVENNNALTKKVSRTREPSPELTVEITELDTMCPTRRLRLRVENTGAARVENVPVELYAGQPSAGGALLLAKRVGPIDPNDDASTDVEIDSQSRNFTLYAVVNPDSTVRECDESNNTDNIEIMCNFSPN